MKQQKLFDDSSLIDKNVVTPSDKTKWKKEFQKLCDSDEIRRESDLTGLNACGYWFACDLCDGIFEHCACSNALINYLEKRGYKIDYKNTSHEYLERLLRGDFDGKAI